MSFPDEAADRDRSRSTAVLGSAAPRIRPRPPDVTWTIVDEPRASRCRAPTGRPAESAPAAAPGHRHRQPEGRRRQDHHRGEPRRLPGRARLPGAGRRPRPAGQRQHRPRDQHPRTSRRSIYDVIMHDVAARGLRRADRRPNLFVRPGQPRPGRRRDRAGARPSAGSCGCSGRSTTVRRRLRLRPHRLPAVARAAHRQRPRRGRPRCSSRSSASTTRSRASASCCATSTSCRRTSTRRSRSATIVLVMYDARTKLADQVVQRGARALRRQGRAGRWCPARCASRRRRRSGSRSSRSTRRSRGAIAYRELAKEVSGGAPQRAG